MVKHAPKTGGHVLDAVEIASGEDPLREAIGWAGGRLGAWAGVTAGGLTGPAAVVASPTLAAVGSHYGEKRAEHLYDQYADDIRRGAGSMKQWVATRQRLLAADAARAAEPFWQGDDYYRAFRR